MNIETRNVECKRELSRGEGFERAVVAFLNSHEGGEILVGVENDGSVCGVPDPDLTQRQISDRILNNIRPATLGLFDVIAEMHDGKAVVRVVVAGGPDRPYHLKRFGLTPQGCFVRVGSQTQQLSERDIEALFARRVRTTLRTIPSPRSDLRFEQLRIRYQEHGKELNERFRENLDLLTPDGKPNLVAFLLADENNVSIKVAKYAGTDKIELVENEEYGFCSILRACDRVLEKLTVENTTSARIGRFYRRERKRYDPAAMREAVINAFVHNDWTNLDCPVFELFSDRLEITSHGSLLPGMTREELLSGCSRVRNRELMRVFRDVELVEQLGSGMRRMLGAYSPDIFRYTDTFFHVALHFKEDETEAPLQGTIQVVPASNDDEEKPSDWPTDWPWSASQSESWSKSWSESWPESWNKAFPPTIANRLLVLLRPSPKGTKTLLPLLGLSTLGHSLRSAMATLLANGLIERTLPGKPNSRFQQYRLTVQGRAALAERTASTPSIGRK